MYYVVVVYEFSSKKDEDYIISLVCDDIAMTVGFYYLLTFTLSKYKKFYSIRVLNHFSIY